MAQICEVKQLTENPFVNLYQVNGTNKKGRPTRYFVASRAKHIENLKLKTHKNTPDGVVIYSLYGEAHDRVVLIRQYRYPIDGYIYELAGRAGGAWRRLPRGCRAGTPRGDGPYLLPHPGGSHV